LSINDHQRTKTKFWFVSTWIHFIQIVGFEELKIVFKPKPHNHLRYRRMVDFPAICSVNFLDIRCWRYMLYEQIIFTFFKFLLQTLGLEVQSVWSMFQLVILIIVKSNMLNLSYHICLCDVVQIIYWKSISVTSVIHFHKKVQKQKNKF
jgi:hypothetical protein